MMERNSFSVLFFLKKTKLLKNGEASVCMRITVNNVRSETNIRKSITPSLWNQAKECSRGKDRKSNDLQGRKHIRLRAKALQLDCLTTETWLLPLKSSN